jgi:preprotein translocase subunit SecY
MLNKIIQIFKIRELRNSILFVLAMLVVFRIAAHIPLPGVNIENLKNFFAQNQILGLLNILSGGAMENFSIVALGVAPYITASIIFQLLTMIIPRLEELSKEGEAGYHKINQYTRLLTVPLAALQSYGMITLLQRSGQQIMGSLDVWGWVTTISVLTAGTVFLMWLGELMTEKRIGNGISLIIFAGIVAGLPAMLQRTIATFDPSQILNLVIFAVLALITVAGVVYITEAQRNVPVSYAKRIRGTRMYGGMETFLPLRVNQAGMIPIIFAISIIMFPPLVAQLLQQIKKAWVINSSQFVIDLFQNQLFYGILYFTLVVAFTYFYTSVVFHPHKIAENLQKQGGFIPGLRPGQPTAKFLGDVSNRIILAGALFLGIIAILPLITQQAFGTGTLVVGGASLLIVVSVVIETVKQIEAQLSMREYERL